MFSGIVEAVGTVASLARGAAGARLVVRTGLRLAAGDSIAVDGVCLTARAPARGSFRADLSDETLDRTRLGRLAAGDRVNLERPLRPTDRLGGHFVLGHVDAVGRVVALRAGGGGARLVVAYPARYHALVVDKGSVAVNGVSLTIAGGGRTRMEFALIPFTLDATNLGGLGAGAEVNLEFDYLAKLVRASIGGERAARRRARSRPGSKES